MNYYCIAKTTKGKYTMRFARVNGADAEIKGFRIFCTDEENGDITFSEWYDNFEKAEKRFIRLSNANNFSEPITLDKEWPTW